MPISPTCAKSNAASKRPGQNLSPDLKLPTAPVGIPTDFEEHIKLMFDLQVLAWQADITRVSTMLMAKELSGATYPKSTIRDAFHTLSHHSNLSENMDKFAVLNRYHVTIFTYLLEEAEDHAGWRWNSARSFHGAVRQRDERRESAQPRSAADRAWRAALPEN